jgi:hypothetical protein
MYRGRRCSTFNVGESGRKEPNILIIAALKTVAMPNIA